MSWQKNIIHLNSGSIVKDLFLKHGGEKRWMIQTFTFALLVGGLGS
jgi:hypothetical protein